MAIIHTWTFSRIDVDANGDGTELHWRLVSQDDATQNAASVYGTVGVRAAPQAANALSKTKAQIINAAFGMITATQGPGWKRDQEAITEARIAELNNPVPTFIDLT